MDTLGDLVARDRAVSGTALRTGGGRSYTYRRFSTTAMKAGNFLRLHGVGAGDLVGVADDPVPETVLAFLGTALLGGRVRFDPPEDTDARVVIAPAEVIERYTLAPGGVRVAYGEAPDDPGIEHFERGVWSENPAFPDTGVRGEDPVLSTPDGDRTHAAVLAAAGRVADEHDLTADDEVAVRASLAESGTVAAGIVAPLAVGATVLLPGEDATGTVAVADGSAPERRAIDPASVSW